MSGCSSSRRSGRAAASRAQRGGWAVIGPRCIASWPAAAGGRAMTPARRTRRRARGRDESERPSWRSIGCWPPRSMSALKLRWSPHADRGGPARGGYEGVRGDDLSGVLRERRAQRLARRLLGEAAAALPAPSAALRRAGP